MKEKATIYDFQRYFNSKSLEPIKLYFSLSAENIEQTNDAVLKWCKENPLETRQDKFLKMYPEAERRNGLLEIKPCQIERGIACVGGSCAECKRAYWFAEAEE